MTIAGIDPADVSAEDIETLSGLHFYVGEFDLFESDWYGSA
jgi:hypothetical protein